MKPERKPRITVAIQAKVLGWLVQHRDTLLQQSLTETCRLIEKDLDVKIDKARLSELEQSIGVVRPKGGATETRRDRCRVLAYELIRVMESLGVAPSDELRDISVGA